MCGYDVRVRIRYRSPTRNKSDCDGLEKEEAASAPIKVEQHFLLLLHTAALSCPAMYSACSYTQVQSEEDNSMTDRDAVYIYCLLLTTAAAAAAAAAAVE